MKKKPAKKLRSKDMKKTKGGAEIARYHLTDAWPSKALESPTFKSTP